MLQQIQRVEKNTNRKKLALLGLGGLKSIIQAYNTPLQSFPSKSLHILYPESTARQKPESSPSNVVLMGAGQPAVSIRLQASLPHPRLLPLCWGKSQH